MSSVLFENVESVNTAVQKKDDEVEEDSMPVEINDFLCDVMWEVADGENELTTSQLITFTSHAYPNKSKEEVSSLVEDLITYQTPF